MSSIIHWHQLTVPADWNRQACTELMEPTLMVSWLNGTFLVWDANCMHMDTFCDSHRQATAKEAGGTVHAETEKPRSIYAHLDRAYHVTSNQSQWKSVVQLAQTPRASSPAATLAGDSGQRQESPTLSPTSSSRSLWRSRSAI